MHDRFDEIYKGYIYMMGVEIKAPLKPLDSILLRGLVKFHYICHVWYQLAQFVQIKSLPEKL